MSDGAGVVGLDLETTGALEREGSCRGLYVSFRLRGATQDSTYLTESTWNFPCPKPWHAAEVHRDWIMEQTLAVDLTMDVSPTGSGSTSCSIDRKPVRHRPCLTFTAAPARPAQGPPERGRGDRLPAWRGSLPERRHLTLVEEAERAEDSRALPGPFDAEGRTAPRGLESSSSDPLDGQLYLLCRGSRSVVISLGTVAVFGRRGAGPRRADPSTDRLLEGTVWALSCVTRVSRWAH